MKLNSIAAHAARVHHHVARRCSCRYRRHDRCGAPTPDRRCRRPVEADRARPLCRAEVRPRDRYRSTHRPRRGRQASDAWRRDHCEVTPLLLTPLVFTTTFPVVAPVGTVATIDVALQLPIVVAAVPLKLTEPVPWVEPKFVPVIVTDAPTAPEVGDKLVMLGAATTVNETPLLFTPLAFTTTFPVVAPVGTVATIDVALQLPIVVAAVPLKLTEPCLASSQSSFP